MCDIFGCNESSDKPLPQVTSEQRRLFMAGLASLPLASVLAYPELAAAQAATVQDWEQDGASGVIAMPEKLPAPAVVLIHEWWGLNDQIKSVAAEFAKLGYIALAIDLYGGTVATTPEDARATMQGVDGAAVTQQLVTAINHLRNHENSTGKVGTIGWCFGGGWSLNASIATAVDATVIYYGRVTRKAEDLGNLQGPVLGHFGLQDQSINEEMVAGFETEMEAAGKTDTLAVHWYDANHAFANPSSARYDDEDAAEAWLRTTRFFSEHLGSS